MTTTLTLVATPDPPDYRRMPVWLIEALDADEGGRWRLNLVTFAVDGVVAVVVLDIDGVHSYHFTLDETNRTIYKQRRRRRL